MHSGIFVIIVCQETNNYLEGQNPRKNMSLKVHAYALRYLKDSRSLGVSSQAEAPTTPDKISDSGTFDMSWEDHLTEVLTKLPYIYLISFLFLYVSDPYLDYFHRVS